MCELCVITYLNRYLNTYYIYSIVSLSLLHSPCQQDAEIISSFFFLHWRRNISKATCTLRNVKLKILFLYHSCALCWPYCQMLWRLEKICRQYNCSKTTFSVFIFYASTLVEIMSLKKYNVDDLEDTPSFLQHTEKQQNTSPYFCPTLKQKRILQPIYTLFFPCPYA